MNLIEVVLGVLALILGAVFLSRRLSDHWSARPIGSLLVVIGLYFSIIGVLQPP
jgi:hypothetical protein